MEHFAKANGGSATEGMAMFCGKRSRGDKKEEVLKSGVGMLREIGGIEPVLQNPNGPQARSLLAILIIVLANKRCPAPTYHEEGERSNGDRWFARVLSKVQCSARALARRQDLSVEEKERQLVDSVTLECNRVMQDMARILDPLRRITDQVKSHRPDGHTQDRSDGHTQEGILEWDKIRDIVNRVSGRERTYQPDLYWEWNEITGNVNWETLGLKPLADLLGGSLEHLDDYVKADGTLDVRKAAAMMGCSTREIRTQWRCLKKNLISLSRKDRRMVPQPFLKVYHRIRELASAPPGKLGDAKLRRELFDISRSLVFGLDNKAIRATGIKRIRSHDFTQAIDRLLDVRQVLLGEPAQRITVENLMQDLQRAKDALEARDIVEVFRCSSSLALNAACLQDARGAARLQIMLAYSFLLRLAGWHDAYIRANEAIARRCDAIAHSRGAAALDATPEFETGATLRRVRTFARLNVVQGLFYFKHTSARERRYVVRDYDDLVSLVGPLRQAEKDDPEADGIRCVLLVLRAHISRAAYNRWRRASGREKQKWQAECQLRRRELVQLIEQERVRSVKSQRLNSLYADEQEQAFHLRECVEVVGEECAKPRALDEISAALRSAHPRLAAAMQEELLSLPDAVE